jgi:O-antigen ligase
LGGGLIVAALLSFGLGTGSASAPRWLAIYALAGGGLVWLLLNRAPRLGAVDIAAGIFLGWAALSLLWSPDHLAGLWQFQNMAALFAVALFVRHAKAFDSLILPVFIICAFALVGMGVAIPHLHGGVGNENFQAETLLLLLPVIIIVSDRRQWLPALSLLAIMVVVLYLFLGNGSHAQYAVLAACVAAVGLWLVRLWGWKGAVALALVCGAVVAEASLYARHFDPILASLVERGEIWLNTAHMIGDKPLFGWGLGSYDWAYPRTAHLGVIEGTFLGEPTDFIGAAHNDFLQLHAELGMVGVFLAAVLVWFATRPDRQGIARQVAPYSLERLAGLATLAVAAVLALVGFPVQNPSSAIVIAIGAGLACRGGATVVIIRPARALGLAVAPLAFSATLFWASQLVVRDIHAGIGHEPFGALSANLRAIKIFPLHPWPRLQSTLTLATVLRTYPERVNLDPKAADKIYALSRSAAPDNPGILLTRVEYLINSGRWQDTDELAGIFATLRERGPLYPQVWAMEAVWHGLSGEIELAENAARTGLALDGGPQIFRNMGLLREITENDQ